MFGHCFKIVFTTLPLFHITGLLSYEGALSLVVFVRISICDIGDTASNPISHPSFFFFKFCIIFYLFFSVPERSPKRQLVYSYFLLKSAHNPIKTGLSYLKMCSYSNLPLDPSITINNYQIKADRFLL